MNKIKRLILVESCIAIILILCILVIISDVSLECFIERNFGILCPSCGGTRMAIYILTGQLLKAFIMHPIFFVVTIYLSFVNIIFIINSLKKGKKICKWIYPNIKTLIILGILILLFTIIRNVI